VPTRGDMAGANLIGTHDFFSGLSAAEAAGGRVDVRRKLA
jgi:hypothetical protein